MLRIDTKSPAGNPKAKFLQSFWKGLKNLVQNISKKQLF